MVYLPSFQRFHEELHGQAVFVNELMHVGNEIMSSCHTNAKRTVSHHLASISARWQQVSVQYSQLWRTCSLLTYLPIELPHLRIQLKKNINQDKHNTYCAHVSQTCLTIMCVLHV